MYTLTRLQGAKYVLFTNEGLIHTMPSERSCQQLACYQAIVGSNIRLMLNDVKTSDLTWTWLCLTRCVNESVRVGFMFCLNKCGSFLPPSEHDPISYGVMFFEFVYDSVCFQVTQHNPIVPVKIIFL